MRLRPESPVAVVQLDVRHDPRIFTDSRSRSARFEPTRLTAALTIDEGTDTPIQVGLYPADDEPIGGYSAPADGRSVRWLLDCQAGEELDCPRRYFVVVGAESLGGDVVVRLSVVAELMFPGQVPTPFMVSIGLDGREIAMDEGAALRATQRDGSTSLSPTMAVAVHDFGFPASEGTLLTEDGVAVAGTVLELRTSRDGPGTPAGLQAPPPIRAAIINSTGSVVMDVGLRPGTPTSVSLPPLEGDHQLVLWWQDRAADSYGVDWSVERGVVGSGPNPIVEAGDAVTPPSVSLIPHESEAELEIGNPRSEVKFGIEIEVGEGILGRLPPAAGVVRLRVELAADATTGPLILILTDGEYGARNAVPVTLEPGKPVELALDAVANCGAVSCQPWVGQLVVPGEPFRTNAVHQSASLSWSARWELWPLDPSMQPPIFRELDR